MMNCFAFISTDPKKLVALGEDKINDAWIYKIAQTCKDIVFAWGNFKVAEQRAKELIQMFPHAQALRINKNGTPQHPLLIPIKTQFIPYK